MQAFFQQKISSQILRIWQKWKFMSFPLKIIVGLVYCLEHWCIPNFNSVAKELVCGGSPIAWVLTECKTQHSGKWRQQQHRTSLDQLRVLHKCTVTGELNGILLLHPVSTLQWLPLNKINQIGRATTGEPTPLEYERFGEWSGIHEANSSEMWAPFW